MTDHRFPGMMRDVRFEIPGDDCEHSPFPTDDRFPNPGEDTRFQGNYCNPAPGPTPTDFTLTGGVGEGSFRGWRSILHPDGDIGTLVPTTFEGLDIRALDASNSSNLVRLELGPGGNQQIPGVTSVLLVTPAPQSTLTWNGTFYQAIDFFMASWFDNNTGTPQAISLTPM